MQSRSPAGKFPVPSGEFLAGGCAAGLPVWFSASSAILQRSLIADAMALRAPR